MSDRKWICADSYMKTALGFWGFFLTADNEIELKIGPFRFSLKIHTKWTFTGQFARPLLWLAFSNTATDLTTISVKALNSLLSK